MLPPFLEIIDSKSDMDAQSLLGSQVPNLAAIAAVTNSEVTMQHLGPCFTASAGQGILEAEMGSAGTQTNFQMPTLRDVEMSQRS